LPNDLPPALDGGGGQLLWSSSLSFVLAMYIKAYLVLDKQQ
jgi:hypothetical protein